MKKILLAALAVALVAVLGCKDPAPGPGSGTNQPATKQSSAELSYIKIGDIQASGKSGGATIAQATGEDLELSASDTTNATVAATLAATSNKATVKYVLVLKANAATEPTAGQFTTTNTFTALADGDIIYVQVTSEDGSTVRYYKFPVTVGMNTKLTGKMYYGVPKLDDPLNAPGSGGYIDPIWNAADIDTYDISRVNRAEDEYASNPWFAEDWGQHTKATAKALWDDRGIWVLADIEFISPYYTGAEDEDGIWTKAGPFTRTAFLNGNEQSNDSLEIFVNERLAAMQQAGGNADGNRNWGNQFRIGADGATGGTNTDLSTGGYPTSPNDGTNVFKDSGQYRAWLKPNNEGYYVLAHVPFLFNPDRTTTPQAGRDQAAVMWEEAGGKKQIKEGARIGFELQINACAPAAGTKAAGRDGILTWSGVTGRAYKNAWSFGLVTLEMGPGRQRVVGKVADAPAITTHPVPKTYIYRGTPVANIAPLTVEAELPATSDAATATLSYQWYTSPTSTGTGTPIPSATTATYTPPSQTPTTVIDNWYWVIVTNTDTSASPGYDKAPLISGKVRIRFTVPPVETRTLDYVELLSGNGASALFCFYLPEDKTLADYTALSVEFRTPDVSRALGGGALRMMGVYGDYIIPENPNADGVRWITTTSNGNPGDGTNGGTYNGYTLFTDTFATISDLASGEPKNNEWFGIRLPIDGSKKHGDMLDAHLPENQTGTGPFYFAVSLPGPASGDGAPIYQHIRNVALVGPIGSPEKVESNGPGEPEPVIISYSGAEANGTAVRLVWKTATLDYAIFVSGDGTAMYFRFDIPLNKTLADYTTLSVDFKTPNVSLPLRGNNMRMLGVYRDYIIPETARTEIMGSSTYKYRFVSTSATGDPGDGTNGGTYNGYILYDQSIGEASPGVGNPLSSLDNLATDSYIANDTWFTLEFPLDGNKKHNAMLDAHLPENQTGTGPFYFAVSLPGEAATPITQEIRKVTLVGAAGTANVVSNGPGTEEPVINAYDTAGSRAVSKPELFWQY
jgi:hypothetical protein